MKKLIAASLILLSCSSFASVMGRYEGSNGTQVDFSVLTYMGGIIIDARLDIDEDSRDSALQSVRMRKEQFDQLFDSETEVTDLELISPFEAKASASGDQSDRTVVITEQFIEGVLVSEKILTLKIKDGLLTSARLKSRQRRGLLNMIPLWMAKVFDKKIELTRTEDGLLLRDDYEDICRVTTDQAIERAQRSGNYEELSQICANN